MLKRDIRLRKDYIYRKSVEQEEAKEERKKEAIMEALSSNQHIRSKDAISFVKKALYDEHLQKEKENDNDKEDEYSTYTGSPKLLITTSRDPSNKLLQFVKEVRLLFPGSQRINRGSHVIQEIIKAARANEVTDLVIIHEHRGIPNAMNICHLPYGPTAFFSLHNVVLRHEVPEAMQKRISEQHPHLIFNNFTSKLGDRVQRILKHLWPSTIKEDASRIVSMINREDYISFRHYTFEEKKNMREKDRNIELKEIGPRWEMRLYQILNGTIDTSESADVEWVLRPYMNTARKRTQL